MIIKLTIRKTVFVPKTLGVVLKWHCLDQIILLCNRLKPLSFEMQIPYLSEKWVDTDERGWQDEPAPKKQKKQTGIPAFSVTGSLCGCLQKFPCTSAVNC